MIEVELNGSVYSGRLMNIHAHDQIYNTKEVVYHENYLYTVEMMDANGVILTLEIENLNQITFVG